MSTNSLIKNIDEEVVQQILKEEEAKVYDVELTLADLIDAQIAKTS